MMTTTIEFATVTKIDEAHYVAFASDLGLKPVEWPGLAIFRHPRGEFRLFRRTCPNTIRGEFSGYDYVGDNVTVYND